MAIQKPTIQVVQFAQVVIAYMCIFAPSAWGKVYQSFADVAQLGIQGVVNIRTTQNIPGREAWSDPYQFFLKGRLPRSSTNHSLGSGVILDKDGYIVTNYHVISGATTIEVLFAKNKEKVAAQIIGIDRQTDLALLRVQSKSGLKPLDFADSDRLLVGDIVLAIGNPFGFAHTVTSGIISAKGRVIGTGPFDAFLQTDASIHPGNSGGPLIDIRGRVVGINTAVSEQGHGIGFAIPANLVKSVIKDLKKYGKVVRPWLGLIGKNIISQDQVGDTFDPTGVYGVIVENLIVEGPAYNSGIQIGDLITAMDKEKIFDTHEFQKKLSAKSPADQIVLSIYRRNKGFVQITVRLAVVPHSDDLPQEKDLF